MKTAQELTDLFRDRGLRVTPQRQAIFRLLHGNDAAPARSTDTGFTRPSSSTGIPVVAKAARAGRAARTATFTRGARGGGAGGTARNGVGLRDNPVHAVHAVQPPNAHPRAAQSSTSTHWHAVCAAASE